MVSALFQKGKKGPILTKLLSWKSVQGCVENPSKYVAQHNWTDFQRKKLCFSFFLKNLILPAERRRFLNKKKTKKWTDFQLKQGQFLDGFSTLQRIYIYIYTYIKLGSIYQSDPNCNTSTALLAPNSLHDSWWAWSTAMAALLGLLRLQLHKFTSILDFSRKPGLAPRPESY